MPLVSKAFGDIITFTRASTGTFFDSAGVLQSAAIDAPRFDYNPSTLAAQGLLIEESRTNNLTYSEDFSNVIWSLSGASVTTNTAVSPAGTTSADSIVEDATTSGHRAAQTATLNSTVAYTATFFIKASGRTWATVLVDDNAGNGVRGFFNLSNGTLGTLSTSGTATNGSQSITAINNGWYRCTVSCIPSTANSGSVRAFVSGTTADTVGTYAGSSGLTSVFVWGAQLEAGAFPTSYIPTTTTALTRAADVASVNTLSPWYNATAGTIYAEATGPIANIYRILAEGASAADFRDFSLSFDGLRGNFTSRFVTGNFDVLGPANSLTAGATVKLAGSYSSTSADLAYGGTLAVTKNAAAQRIPADRMFLGSRLGTSLQLNGHLRRLTYYPRTLSTAELQAITA
jgi:hypothetical protein